MLEKDGVVRQDGSTEAERVRLKNDGWKPVSKKAAVAATSTPPTSAKADK